MNTRRRMLLLVMFLMAFHFVWSQQKQSPVASGSTSALPKDSTREVHLIRSDVLKFEKRDSVELQILVGNAMLRQEKTFFDGDSIVMNKQQNIIEVFGNIHINDADSVNVYSQYLIYFGNTRIAHLRKNVKLTDGKATLTTEELEYDLNSKTGTYLNGGKIVTSTSTLTSKEGYYYADTRDAYFTKKVNLIDPEYTMATDTLLYNVDAQIATFVSPTTINDGKSIIRTSDGYYDMKKGLADFGKRPVIDDSTQHITADHISFDKATGEGFAEGNFVYVDTTQGYTVLSGKSFFNRDKKTFLATMKPVAIFKRDGDSMFITGDTLYSGIKLDTAYVKDTSKNDLIGSKPIMAGDSSAISTEPPGDSHIAFGKDSASMSSEKTLNPQMVRKPSPSHPGKPSLEDVLQSFTDTTTANIGATLKIDTASVLRTQNNGDIVQQTDSVQHDDTLKNTLSAPKLALSKVDTIKNVRVLDIDKIDSVRFFQAFHNVRMFSDSMQAVCDSLVFSGKDSIFRLFSDPIVWAKESQITGDTIFLYTKNKKPEHIEVLENAFSVNKSNDSFYNQLKGNTINGFFRDGDIEHIVAKGSAESLYYLQDEDSAYTGANYAQADLINLYLEKKELQKISWLFEVVGGFYPVNQVPEERQKFRNFKWYEARRPKTKLELFE